MQDKAVKPLGIVIHAGAGTILKSEMSDDMETEIVKKLQESINAGFRILDKGGASLDAVQKAINVMEDSHLFNAGHGAVFTHDGRNEQDATIMDGATRQAGAVAAVRHVKNPIDLARLVMEKSPHVLLAGEGAEIFAESQSMELVDDKYFFTERRWQQLQKALEKEKKTPAADDKSAIRLSEDDKFGTVGAVALDMASNLAAATSSGGMTNKKFGRIGDSAMVGAGTYADNNTCAVSTTGHGEYFMRAVAAYDVAALMAYRGLSLPEAARTVVDTRLTQLGGAGGLIAIDKHGCIALPFNTEGMYRGFLRAGGELVVAIFSE